MNQEFTWFWLLSNISSKGEKTLENQPLKEKASIYLHRFKMQENVSGF